MLLKDFATQFGMSGVLFRMKMMHTHTERSCLPADCMLVAVLTRLDRLLGKRNDGH